MRPTTTQALRVAIIGADATRQLFGDRDSIGETVQLNGLPYTVIGKIRKKDQDSNYSGPDNDKVFIPFATMASDFPRLASPPASCRRSSSRHASGWWIELPACSTRAPVASRTSSGRSSARSAACWRHATISIPADRNAIAMWDTTLQTLMFDRMVQTMKDFFTVVGLVTLALGGVGVMNIMLVAVQERTREIGVRKALGATTRQIQRQFFLEGFLLTMISGAHRVRARPRPVRGGEHAADAGAVSGHDGHLGGRRVRGGRPRRSSAS